MENSNRIYNALQIILFSAATACMSIAAAVLFFSEENLFLNSPFPALGMMIAMSVWLLRK